MQRNTLKKNLFLSGLKMIAVFWRWLLKIRNALNQWMKGKFTANKIALVAMAAVGIIWIIMLFVPPFMGVSDDGSLYKVMNRTGLVYIEDNPEDIYNNYFIKRYLIENNSLSRKEIGSSHDLLIRGAIALDKMITKDQFFDIRFLAFLYGVMYLPAIYLIVKYTCLKAMYFSEAAIIGFLSVFIFADISFVSYFNSLYPEALWFISILYCAAAIFRLEHRKGSYLSLIILGLFGMILTTTRQQCGIIGFILTGFCVGAISFNKQLRWKVSCMLLVIILSITAMISLFTMEADFDLTSKHHAITRGVLFQATNPEEALKELGINPSFAVLAKTSTYNFYPLIEVGNEHLQEEFYDKYTTGDIVNYYIKHPVSFFRMLDIAVKDTTNLRRNFCGNYEKSAGLPGMAQGLFWSGWSDFKVRFAPKTVGYLFVLVVSAYLLSKRKKSKRLLKISEQEINLLFIFSIILAMIGISQASISIAMSGDSEFTQHAFLLGATMDVIVFGVAAQIIPRLNIFKTEV
ncbi:MAG: glycan biosynthesis hexose transferase WsfD [Mobilitalea sp.]